MRPTSATIVAFITLLASVVSIISFFEPDPQPTVILIPQDESIPEMWRRMEIYDAFSDSGRYYVIRYNRTLDQISKEEYEVIT
ncbi:MAG TPA: hypothetical protein PKJ51_00140, partial [Methanothrix sp.]|nr:hypothetical protein [Methanothrix sp.]